MWDQLNEFINRTDENDSFAQQMRNEIRSSGQSNELKTFRRGALRELRRTLMEQAQDETILRAETYPGGDKTFALPGLIEGIQSSNPDRRLSAFTHLIDNFRSENFVRSAVAGTDLLEKCLFCFMRSRRNMITSKYQDESMLLHLLETLSTYKKCAEEMSKNKRFVTEMYKIIFNIQNDQQHRAAKILSNITKHSEQEALVFLKRHNAFNEISKIFNRQTCTMYMPTELWRHLGHLLEVAPEKAIKKGFFDIFYYRIKYKLPNFHFENMKCFALLLRSKLGRDVFDHCEDGMSVFYALVHKPTELSDYENTLEALNEALLSPYSIDKASEFEHFPKAIMQVAKRYENKKVRLNCFSILRKMYQSFRLRHEILQYCMPALKNLKCDSTDVEYNRYELISWINRNQLSSKWY